MMFLQISSWHSLQLRKKKPHAPHTRGPTGVFFHSMQSTIQHQDSGDRKRKFEQTDSEEETSEETDSTWNQSSCDDESEQEKAAEVATLDQVNVIHTRSRGVVVRNEGVDAAMDKADEEVNNESDFSTDTDSEEDEEEDEEDEDDMDLEEEEEEEDTEDDGYSDDDSFITSDEDENEGDEEISSAHEEKGQGEIEKEESG